MKKEHLEMLLEDVKEKLDFLIEGNRGLHYEIRGMRRGMNERFDRINLKFERFLSSCGG